MGSQQLKQTFVLDTCAWIWITQGDKRITRGIQSRLIEADWLVSAISVWEVAMLASKKRIDLNCSIEQWIDKALINVPRMMIAPLAPEIAVRSCNLRGYKHSDPADRIIIATALYYKTAVVTGDAKIIDYCNSGHLPVILL